MYKVSLAPPRDEQARTSRSLGPLLRFGRHEGGNKAFLKLSAWPAVRRAMASEFLAFAYTGQVSATKKLATLESPFRDVWMLRFPTWRLPVGAVPASGSG